MFAALFGVTSAGGPEAALEDAITVVKRIDVALCGVGVTVTPPVEYGTVAL